MDEYIRLDYLLSLLDEMRDDLNTAANEADKTDTLLSQFFCGGVDALGKVKILAMAVAKKGDLQPVDWREQHD